MCAKIAQNPKEQNQSTENKTKKTFVTQLGHLGVYAMSAQHRRLSKVSNKQCAALRVPSVEAPGVLRTVSV